MGKYQNGIETQEKILEACRKFFYEKGYDKTTFADISRATGINQSAIHYHFKSKEKLLQLIYIESVKKNNDLVEFYSDRSTGALAKFFFGGELFLYKAVRDEKFRRFYLDATRLLRTDISTFVFAQSSVLEYLKFDMRSGDEDWKFDLMVCASLDQVVLYYVDSNEGNVDMEGLLKKVENAYRKILSISDEDFREAKEQMAILEDRCKWDEIDSALC